MSFRQSFSRNLVFLLLLETGSSLPVRRQVRHDGKGIFIDKHYFGMMYTNYGKGHTIHCCQ